MAEFDVDLELSEEVEADDDEDDDLEPEPDSEPLESEPESLDRDLRLDWRGPLLPPAAEEACEAEVVVALVNFEPEALNADLELADTLLLCPLSLLLLVLLHVDMGLAAPLLSLFRYTLEDLTCKMSEAVPDTAAVEDLLGEHLPRL